MIIETKMIGPDPLQQIEALLLFDYTKFTAPGLQNGIKNDRLGGRFDV